MILPRLVARLADKLETSSGWETLRPGVRSYELYSAGKTGPTVALLRYEPGARVPPHRHSGTEVIYVLQGSQSDERGRYDTGTLVVNSEGDVHSVWSDGGCVVLIVWTRPIEFIEP